VLRQSAESEEYLASGQVEISRADLQGLQPIVFGLLPERASLKAGEGVTFEFDLQD